MFASEAVIGLIVAAGAVAVVLDESVVVAVAGLGEGYEGEE